MNNRQKTVLPLLFFLFSLFFNGCTPTEFPFQEQKAVITSANTKENALVPIGKSVGVTLSTDGVIVAGISETVNQKKSPAKEAGLKQGDIIVKFNGQKITNVEDLTKNLCKSKGLCASITIIRHEKNIELMITPVFSEKDNRLVIGAWVKDAASGIGTLTFFDPKTKKFGALGHGICDTETGKLLRIDSGAILSSTIVSVDKGEKGSPGELNGVFSEEDAQLGEVTNNFDYGICGTASDNFPISATPLPVAKISEITTGKASIMANVEGNIVDSYEIEILRLLPHRSSSAKNMIIKITDQRLLEKTGGIVQGMSGSPIVQNGKLVGAVTHVFVNDPTRGYGIFIENMLAEAEKIK